MKKRAIYASSLLTLLSLGKLQGAAFSRLRFPPLCVFCHILWRDVERIAGYLFGVGLCFSSSISHFAITSMRTQFLDGELMAASRSKRLALALGVPAGLETPDLRFSVVASLADIGADFIGGGVDGFWSLVMCTLDRLELGPLDVFAGVVTAFASFAAALPFSRFSNFLLANLPEGLRSSVPRPGC